MKHEFVKHSFGWIRGPKYTKMLVRYLQSNSGMKLSSGGCVSRYFGIVIRTRVTLSYVIEENTFWMRILPPVQSVKNEFPAEVVLIDSDDDEGVDQNTNAIAGTMNKKNKATPNKTKICKVIYICFLENYNFNISLYVLLFFGNNYSVIVID
jgi:hypothetical protein